ncbi:MAG: methyltransferase family protein [Candidatus Thorarchaeota archaeon]
MYKHYGLPPRLGRALIARISLALFWLVATILGLIVIKRRLDGISSFVGIMPSDIPKWGYVVIPLALLSFLYLTALTVLYIWVPAIAIDFVFIMVPLDTSILEALRLVGAGLTFIGTLIFLTAFFHLGSSIRLLIPEEEEGTRLMTDGWYAHSRNPLYLGIHIAMIGWVFILPSLLTGLALVIFLVNQHFRILLEEKFLEDRFGEDYRAYKKRVRRYL